MGKIDFIRNLENYFNALQDKDNNKIEKMKYRLLCEASNFFELVANYVALGQKGIMFDFGKHIILKGKKLYRIRKYVPDTDFSKECEWKAPPHKFQNRANFLGQKALYLGSTEDVCLLETHIKKGGKYALGIYEVMEDIEVGGFLSFNPNNMLHNYAGMILNAFLIAPVRSKINTDLFLFLDSHYGKLTLDDFTNMKELKKSGGFDLPIKFGVLNQRDKYYNLTNQVCNILSKNAPNGIKYSSCYIPMGTVGIECSEFNIVLYEHGIEKVKFIDFKENINKKAFTGEDTLKVLFEKY